MGNLYTNKILDMLMLLDELLNLCNTDIMVELAGITFLLYIMQLETNDNLWLDRNMSVSRRVSNNNKQQCILY